MDLKKIEKCLGRCIGMLDKIQSSGVKDGSYLLTPAQWASISEDLRCCIRDLVMHDCDRYVSTGQEVVGASPNDEGDLVQELDDRLSTNVFNEDNEPLSQSRKRRKDGRPAGEVKRAKFMSPKLEQNSTTRRLSVSPELRNLLLWVNSLPSCYRKDEKALPPKFDVLKGKDFDHYGLYSATSWRQHLAMLLLALPHFRHNNYLFFAQLFQQSAALWRQKIKAFEKLLKNEPMANYYWKYCSKEKGFMADVMDPMINGRVDYGMLQNDSEELERTAFVEDHAEETSTLDELSGELITTGLEETEFAVKKEPENTTREASELLSRISAKVLKPFGTMQYYGYKRHVLPELKTRHCVALLGIAVGSSSKCSLPLKTKVLVKSPSAHAGELQTTEEELQNIVSLLRECCGMSQKSIFKWKEMVPQGEGYAYRKYLPKRERGELLKADPEYRKEKLRLAREEFKPFEERNQHMKVVELPAEVGEIQSLEVTQDLPWSNINNVALLFTGSDEADDDRYLIKTLFTEECLDKFIREADTCRTATSQKLNHSQFCRTVIEVFKSLAGLEARDLVIKFPDTFGKKFRAIRRAWNAMKDLEDMQDTVSRQCDYCGKVFSCHTTTMDGQSITLHIKKCRLEKANCECGLTFASPREKRHHMLLKHSGIKYLECTQCHYLTQKRDALDHHVEYFHGFPGREESCDLCTKTFRSKYHLSIHQFTHESHWCNICSREFVGRLPYRNHSRQEHGAGEECDICGKVMATTTELAKHNKLHHQDKSWMSS